MASDEKRELPNLTTRPRKPYTTPTLVEYGSVVKLTQAGGLSAADGPVGKMMN
jgi:hypothetical protein